MSTARITAVIIESNPSISQDISVTINGKKIHRAKDKLAHLEPKHAEMHAKLDDAILLSRITHNTAPVEALAVQVGMMCQEVALLTKFLPSDNFKSAAAALEVKLKNKNVNSVDQIRPSF